MGAGPDLTIVLLLSRRYAWLRRTVLAWSSQEGAERIEAIVVRSATLRAEEVIEDDFAQLWGYKVVDVPRLDTAAGGFVAGVRAARGHIVMLAEDHAFPEPGLAEKLLAAYEDPAVAAAGPVMFNANPETLASATTFVLAFSAVAYAHDTRPARALGGHNTSYRRELLVGYGDDLLELYRSERVLQFDIERRGGVMILIADARMAHYNFSRWRPVIVHAYTGGRLFAAQRCRAWRRSKRALYAAAAPLIPLIRFRRLLADLRESPDASRETIPKLLPTIIFTLSVHAVGEMMGYAFGPGNADRRYAPFELYRRDQLVERERREIDRL